MRVHRVAIIALCWVISAVSASSENPDTFSLWNFPTQSYAAEIFFNAKEDVVIAGGKALNLSNGLPIWNHEQNFGIAHIGERLFMTDQSSTNLFAVDGNTGAILWTTPLLVNSSQVQASVDLTTATTPMLHIAFTTYFNQTSYGSQKNFTTHIWRVDPVTGVALWKYSTPYYVNGSQAVSISSGFGYAVIVSNHHYWDVGPVTTWALDATTGKYMWTCQTGCCAADNYLDQATVLSDEYVVAPYYENANTDPALMGYCGIYLKTGAPAWNTGNNTHWFLEPPKAIGNTFFALSNIEEVSYNVMSSVYAYDLVTGEQLWSFNYWDRQHLVTDAKQNLVFVSTWDVIIALDAKKGVNVWNWTVLDIPSSEYYNMVQMETFAFTSDMKTLVCSSQAPQSSLQTLYASSVSKPQPIKAITSLSQNWCNGIGGAQAGQYFVPLVVGDLVFASGYSTLTAVDKASGLTRWSFQPSTQVAWYPLTYPVAGLNHSVITGWQNGQLCAVNQSTGSTLWMLNLDVNVNAASPMELYSPSDLSVVVVNYCENNSNVMNIDGRSTLTGSRLWHISNATVAQVVANSVYAFTETGITAFNSVSGTSEWTCTSAVCLSAYALVIYEPDMTMYLYNSTTLTALHIASKKILWSFSGSQGYAGLVANNDFLAYLANYVIVIMSRASGLIARTFPTSYGWDGPVTPTLLDSMVFYGSTVLTVTEIIEQKSLTSFNESIWGSLSQVVYFAPGDRSVLYTTWQTEICQLKLNY